MFPELERSLDEMLHGFERIDAERREALERIAAYVTERNSAGGPARLTFICTHNSRRSQLAQLWASAAAAKSGLEGVETFSGGTEATAFDRRAVAALRRAGFRIERRTGGANPVYEVRFREESPSVRAFSKVHDEAPNPGRDHCAVMTCSDADRACPDVRGAALRVALAYEDPKAFDGTDRESAAYDDCSQMISQEMLYLFSRVRPPADAGR